MQLDLERTIVALASPVAPGQRAIVRLSGSETQKILRAALRPLQSLVGDADESTVTSGLAFLDSATAVYGRALVDLDWCDRSIEAGVYFWPGSRSFTGQPSAELHILGSFPLAQRLLQRLVQLGAHPADRGEFSLRSFLAGKIDLVQAEAVLGVIESVVGEQLEWALTQLGGNLSQPVRKMRVEILNLLADLEAGLDFVEEDIEFITDSQLLTRLEVIDQQLVELELQLHSRGAAHRPLELTLVGLPNAGKSSLFNALLGQDRSIASSQSGTTRDPVVARLTLGELQQQQITLVDTAGLEPATDDSPRSLAQTMLHRRLQAADVVMLCIDLSQPPSADWIQQQMDALRQNHRTLVCVGTKLDLLEHDASGIQAAVLPSIQKVVSIHQQESIRSLLDFLRHQVELKDNLRFTEATHHTAVRFREAVVRSRESLDRARSLIRTGEGQELVASELHAALDELGTIIGAVHNDDILGQIFSRFCIGK